MQNDSDSAAILRGVLEQYEQNYTGQGERLEDALNEAWENGKRASGHHVYRVDEIFIRGDNPLSGYGVVISPHG